MADEPTSDGPPLPLDDAPDAFFAAAPERSEDEFWSEAEGKSSKNGATRTRARRRHEPKGPRARGPRNRLAAAWAAEASARRALRGRSGKPAGSSESHRKRRIAAGIVGGVALLAVALAVGESVVNDGPRSDRADAESATVRTGSEDQSSYDDTSSGIDQTAVESEIVDAPASTRKTKTKSRPAATPTTTAVKSSADPAAPKLPTPGSSGPKAPTPGAPAPATPVTTSPAPATTVPPTPTTAPRPPAAPTVQSFTAKAATTAGGACPPLQWAMTFTWATTDATSVQITGLLETTLSNLPGDGSRVVCRLLPTGPIGGWTLTATGPGGRVTATA